MTWTEFKTLVTSRFTPKYANIRAGVAWFDLRQTHSIKAYVGKFQGVVSTLQHVSDYDKQLKFIHELQPWERKLIIRIPQLPDNLQDLMRMVVWLGMTRWTRRGWRRGQQLMAGVQEAQKEQTRLQEVGVQTQQCAEREKAEGMGGRKLPKDKDACFGCGEMGRIKKDCPKR